MSDTTHELPDHLLAIHAAVAKLKRLGRRGWERRGVPDPESVADHTFAVSALALVAARDLGLDAGRAVAMAVLHEVCESLVGDIIPADGVAPEEKCERETRATREILDQVDPTGELFALWEEFEHERSPEGALVKQLDRVEMALQAAEYERATGLDLSEFRESAAERVEIPGLVDVLNRLR
jgi:putative hydrolase of HD superfamily